MCCIYNLTYDTKRVTIQTTYCYSNQLKIINHFMSRIRFRTVVNSLLQLICQLKYGFWLMENARYGAAVCKNVSQIDVSDDPKVYCSTKDAQ